MQTMTLPSTEFVKKKFWVTSQKSMTVQLRLFKPRLTEHLIKRTALLEKKAYFCGNQEKGQKSLF